MSLNDYKRHETVAVPVGRRRCCEGAYMGEYFTRQRLFSKSWNRLKIRPLGRALEPCDSRADPDPLGGQMLPVNERDAIFPIMR